jgi:hypothetical protein
MQSLGEMISNLSGAGIRVPGGFAPLPKPIEPFSARAEWIIKSTNSSLI